MMENMEIASAKEIETSLRQRLDTESIAIAREAATYEEGTFEPAPVEEPTEETGVAFEEPAAEDIGATQPIEQAEVADEAPLQVEEQEVVEQPPSEPSAPQEEPFVSSQEPDVRPDVEEETVVEEPARSEESAAVVEEPPPPEEPAAVEEPAVGEEPAAVEEQESPAEEEVEREEPTLAEESSSQRFFDQEEAGRSSEEDERDNRIFRASRFLRRRE